MGGGLEGRNFPSTLPKDKKIAIIYTLNEWQVLLQRLFKNTTTI
jgi:hypothetical protein